MMIDRNPMKALVRILERKASRSQKRRKIKTLKARMRQPKLERNLKKLTTSKLQRTRKMSHRLWMMIKIKRKSQKRNQENQEKKRRKRENLLMMGKRRMVIKLEILAKKGMPLMKIRNLKIANKVKRLRRRQRTQVLIK